MTEWTKNLPAMQETRVQSLGQEDPLEEGMATRSGVLAWRISWTEEPGGTQAANSRTQLKQLSTHACTALLFLASIFLKRFRQPRRWLEWGRGVVGIHNVLKG